MIEEYLTDIKRRIPVSRLTCAHLLMLPAGQSRKGQNGFAMLLCLMLCIAGLSPARAQSAQQDMARFRAVFQKIQSLPAYQYETVTNATYPNGQKDQLNTRFCVDRNKKRLYYKTNSELLIISDQWIFSADLFNKQISIFNKSKYAKYKDQLPDFNAFFNSGLIKSLADSTIFRYATVRKMDTSGDLLTFKLGFPKGFYVEDFVLVYNMKTALPNTIRFRQKYANGQQAGSSAKSSVYETVCKNYTREVSENTFDTRKYFYIGGGKVRLLQFKNYHVSSVL